MQEMLRVGKELLWRGESRSPRPSPLAKTCVGALPTVSTMSAKTLLLCAGPAPEAWLRQIPPDWEVHCIVQSNQFLGAPRVPGVVITPIPDKSVLRMPELAAVAFAAGFKDRRAIFGSVARRPDDLAEMSTFWMASPAAVVTLTDARFPLVPDCWGCATNFLAVTARAIEARVGEWMRATRRPRDWSTFPAEVLRDVAWPRLKCWGYLKWTP